MSDSAKIFECKISIRCDDGSKRIVIGSGRGASQREAIEEAERDVIGAIERSEREAVEEQQKSA